MSIRDWEQETTKELGSKVLLDMVFTHHKDEPLRIYCPNPSSPPESVLNFLIVVEVLAS
jgi:hypothetical protein